MINSLLNGLRALDLTDEKGGIAGKILAMMGVDVIKIEKPDGDPSRHLSPFYQNTPDTEKSLYWFAFNTDKRSITLNLESTDGQKLFKKLAKHSDFILESFLPGYLDSLGIGYSTLNKLNPKIIMTSITPFGQNGPYSHYKGSELVALAMSGTMASSGDPDRAPQGDPPGATYFIASAAAACGSIVSHYHRQITGKGQQVDISIREAATSRNTGSIMWYEVDKILKKRSGAVSEWGFHPWRQIWKCKDGYIFWIFWGGPLGAPGNKALCKWMEEDGLENPLGHVSDWNAFDMSTVTAEVHNAFQDAINKFFLRHTKEEFAREGLKRGLRAVVVANPADVLDNFHLKARDYWVDLSYPELGVKLKQPKRFFLCSETENFVKRRAPLIGEDNDAIYKKELKLSSKKIIELQKAGVI